MSLNPHILIHPFLTPFHLVKGNFVFLIHAFPCFGNKFVGINFLVTPVSDVIGYLSFSFFRTSSWVMIFRSFCGGANGTVSFFSMANIPLCTWTTSFTFFCCWTFWILPRLIYGKCSCSVGLPACVFSILLCSGDRCIKGPTRSHGSSIFTLKGTSIMFSLLAVTSLHPPSS